MAINRCLGAEDAVAFPAPHRVALFDVAIHAPRLIEQSWGWGNGETLAFVHLQVQLTDSIEVPLRERPLLRSNLGGAGPRI